MVSVLCKRLVASNKGIFKMCSLFSTAHPNTLTKVKEITKKNAKEMIFHYDTILLDCDGVLWKTDYVNSIPGIPETIQHLRDLGKKILFVTNNSRLSRESCTKKFREHGIDPGAPDDIFCVCYSIAIYLKNVLKITGSVYTIGSEEMERELTLQGIDTFGAGIDSDAPSQNTEDLLNMGFRDNVQAVVVAFDEHFNYTKLYKATSYLKDPTCHFIVPTRRGKSVQIAPGRFQPLTGPVVSAVSMASDRTPLVIGKPASHMFETILTTNPLIEKSRCLMVGDSLNADIGFAKACGIDSVFVLNGADTLQSLQNITDEKLLPDYYLQSLNELHF